MKFNIDNQNFKNSEVNQPFLKLLLIVWAFTIISQLGSLAYSSSQSEYSFDSVVLQSLMFLTIITVPLGGLGIWLGPQIGLGTPLLSALIQKLPGASNKLFNDIKLSFLLGLITGGILILIRQFTEPYLPPELPGFGHRGIIGGLLVSIGAAIGEEVWFRLGLMTIILWAVSRVLGHKEMKSFIVWLIIVLVSIGFGLAHLPQLLSYNAGSVFAISGTILGNSLVGILYGWCYWRLSFIAAVTAHFSVDLVIHVIPAFFL